MVLDTSQNSMILWDARVSLGTACERGRGSEPLAVGYSSHINLMVMLPCYELPV